jgi:hypothetical protein
MRADVLRHRVKVVFPGIFESMIIAKELDAAAIDLGFDLVPDLLEILLRQGPGLFGRYEGYCVGHRHRVYSGKIFSSF